MSSHLPQEQRYRVLEERVRHSPIVHVSPLDNLQGHIHDRRDPDRRVLPLELDVQERLNTDGLPLELRRSKPLAVPPANLAENAHGRMCVLVIVRQWAQKLPKPCHDLVDDGRHERIEKLLREVVDAELEGAKTLADELWAGLKSMDEGPHEVAEVGEEDRESNGDCEDELGEQVAAALVGGFEERVQLFEKDLQEGEDLLVQDLESTAADAAKEGAKEEIVRVGFGGLAGEL